MFTIVGDIIVILKLFMMQVSVELASQTLTVCSMIIGNFPTESHVNDLPLVTELKNLCNLLKTSFQTYGLIDQQTSKKLPETTVQNLESLHAFESYVPQRSMVFHNSKYKNFRRSKNFPKCSSLSLDSVSSSVIENFVQSPTSNLRKTNIFTECDDINVIYKPEKCHTSKKKPESENFVQPEEPRFSNNVSVSSKYREHSNSMSFVSEKSSYHVETVVPRKSSDRCSESILHPVSNNIAAGNFSEFPEETCFESKYPCSFPSVFDCLPENKACKIQGISRVSTSCNGNFNERNIKKSAYVRTENLVDVLEISPQKLGFSSSWLPPPPPLPIEEVLAALDRLSSKDQPG